MKDRVFTAVFTDATVKDLVCASTEAWWDGHVLMLVGHISYRTSTMYKWPDASEMLMPLMPAYSLGQAVRLAVKHTDDFFLRAFADETLPNRQGGDLPPDPDAKP